MYGAAALGMGWLFLRRHGRLFSARESWRMVIYCSLLAVLMESWALLAMLTWPEDYPGVSISPESAKFAILIAAIIDSLAMLIAFKVGIPKYLGKYVPMNDEESAHDA
jgi:hypothetical protein